MKKYCIKTFGCQMNEADSEKINMLLLQSGFLKVGDFEQSDLIIFNTCSVRKKGEDRVFSMIRDIEKQQKNGKKTIIGITGCMVRKTGINEKYGEKQQKRETAKKIEALKKISEIFNNDDKLFPRLKNLDFTFRIEEIKYLPFILSHIFGEKIGQEDKYDDYLKLKQQRENPNSASIIIQTGCDNYCSYCIVPYTRGREISRDKEEILSECREAIKNGAKEISLLGQNVNSYGKQAQKDLWDEEKSKWKGQKILKIGIDIDEVLVKCWESHVIENYNMKYQKNFQYEDLKDFDFNGDGVLKKEWFCFFEENYMQLKLFPGVLEILKKWKTKGHKLFIITSRTLAMKEGTLRYLENIFGNDFFEEILFTLEHGEDKKSILAKKIQLDVVLEDNPHQILDYKKHEDWKTIIFSKPWNREEVIDNKNHFRAESWEEIDTIIDSLSFVSPFRELLNEVNAIPGIERIRFTSSNPHDMTYDILDAHFELEHSCNYLHFALQSGSNTILKKMNRRHTYEDFKEMIQYLRKKDPLFAISTDIIVGFSGETEADFLATLRAFEECEFDFAYIARYSVRPGTLASRLYPDDVADTIKAERWHILNNALKKSLQKRNQLMLGRQEEVFVVGEAKNQFFGRTRNFKEVFFDTSPDIHIGDMVQVKIVSLDDWVLKGERVEEKGK
ncbi:radical SAM protein [Candidatus Gracilibacteria bacterium]|nr:radical SAM protein [Candidatus Gracilibacteria bacterium]